MNKAFNYGGIKENRYENRDTREDRDIKEGKTMIKEESNKIKKVQDQYNARTKYSKRTRTNLPTYNIRAINNWIKSIILDIVLEPRDIVFDICCGSGGDLNKFRHANIAEYIGVDFAKKSVQYAIEVYKGMKLKFNNRDVGSSYGTSDRYERRNNRVEHDRYNKDQGKIFAAKFFEADCHNMELSNILINHVSKFDVSSCMFAVHYSFQSIERARGLLYNASRLLKSGGRFVCTIPNAQVLCQRYISALESHGRKFDSAIESNDRKFDSAIESQSRMSTTGCQSVCEVSDMVIELKDRNFMAKGRDDEKSKDKEIPSSSMPEKNMDRKVQDKLEDTEMTSEINVDNKVDDVKHDNNVHKFGNKFYTVDFACSKDKISQINKIHKTNKMYIKDGSDKIDESLFGICYYFKLQDAIEDDCPEYLVHIPTFQMLGAEFGLRLEGLQDFKDIYETYTRDIISVPSYDSKLHNPYYKLLQIMNIRTPTAEEMELIGLYTGVIFIKE